MSSLLLCVAQRSRHFLWLHSVLYYYVLCWLVLSRESMHCFTDSTSNLVCVCVCVLAMLLCRCDTHGRRTQRLKLHDRCVRGY